MLHFNIDVDNDRFVQVPPTSSCTPVFQSCIELVEYCASAECHIGLSLSLLCLGVAGLACVQVQVASQATGDIRGQGDGAHSAATGA